MINECHSEAKEQTMVDLRIAMVSTRFKPGVGGCEEETFQLSRQLIKQGHEVTVYTSDLLRTSPSFEYIRSKSNTFEGIPVRRLHAARLLDNYPVMPLLGTTLLAAKASIFHLHAYGSFASDIGALVASLRGIPYVISPHGYFPEISKRFDLKRKCYVTASTLTTLRKAKKVICESRWIARYFLRLVDPEKIVKIPLGISMEEWAKPPKGGILRKKLNLNTYTIACIGRVTEDKGFQYVIKSMPQVLKSFTETCLVVAGEDFGYMRELRALVDKLDIRDNVLFAILSRNEIRELYAEADIVAIPSLHGSLPTVALEAMACGKPIVATRVGGIPEELEDGANALLVEPTNHLQIAQAIVTLLGDKAQRRIISSNNLAKTTRYSWNYLAMQISKVYREAIEA